jgi:hypothetical protein
MSSVVKAVKKGFSSAASKVKGALKGDLGDLASVATLGASDRAMKNIGRVKDAILPDMPDINIPENPVVGATPGTVSKAAPNVDIGATEGMRRTGGSAKGSRKLRVPLGGLRS